MIATLSTLDLKFSHWKCHIHIYYVQFQSSILKLFFKQFFYFAKVSKILWIKCICKKHVFHIILKGFCKIIKVCTSPKNRPNIINIYLLDLVRQKHYEYLVWHLSLHASKSTFLSNFSTFKWLMVSFERFKSLKFIQTYK